MSVSVKQVEWLNGARWVPLDRHGEILLEARPRAGHLFNEPGENSIRDGICRGNGNIITGM